MSFIKLCIISIFCFSTVAFGESDSALKHDDAMGYVSNAYRVESDEYMGSFKRTVEVRLAYKLSLEQLKAVAEKIKAAETRKTERTFIGYTLEEQQSQGYWATTHYNPDLNVQILEN